MWSKVIATGILAFIGLLFAWPHLGDKNSPSQASPSVVPGAPLQAPNPPPPPRAAVIVLRRGPQQVVSKKPLVIGETLTFHNGGDGLAKDIVLSCGILQKSEESSHGGVPPIEPHSDVTVRIYVTDIPDDALHRNDPIYCFEEPVLSYVDESGKHSVSFDPATGQASPDSER